MALRWAYLSLEHIRIGSIIWLWICRKGKIYEAIHSSFGRIVVVIAVALIMALIAGIE
jgi:hypothetical protein